MKNPKKNHDKTFNAMNRKGFLKTAGIGTVALASVPALLGSLGTRASAAEARIGFRFVANSFTPTVEGVKQQAGLSGNGFVTRSQVVGGGTFFHIIFTSPVPKSIVASGTWKAKRLISFELAGTYGSIAAGVLEMWIHLVPTEGNVVPAKLTIVCNIGAAGISTGEEEGFVLDIPGTPFSEGGTFGQFEPATPAVGLSVFNLLNEQRD